MISFVFCSLLNMLFHKLVTQGPNAAPPVAFPSDTSVEVLPSKPASSARSCIDAADLATVKAMESSTCAAGQAAIPGDLTFPGALSDDGDNNDDTEANPKANPNLVRVHTGGKGHIGIATGTPPSTSPPSAAALELKGVNAAAIVDAPDDATDDFFDNFEASTNEEELHDVSDDKMPSVSNNLPDAENALDNLPTHGDASNPSSAVGSVDNLPAGGDVHHPLSVAGGGNTAAGDNAAFCPVSAADCGDATAGSKAFCPLSGAGGGTIPAPTPAPCALPVPFPFIDGNGPNSGCI